QEGFPKFAGVPLGQDDDEQRVGGGQDGWDESWDQTSNWGYQDDPALQLQEPDPQTVPEERSLTWRQQNHFAPGIDESQYPADEPPENVVSDVFDAAAPVAEYITSPEKRAEVAQPVWDAWGNRL